MRTLLLALLVAATAFATTVIVSIDGITSTQATIHTRTDQAGNCTYRASEGISLPGTSVNDVNAAYFSGANSDARIGSSIIGNIHTFVLGTRVAQVDSNLFKHSRALQTNTQHVVGVTCGSDIEVIQIFNTANAPLGNTYNDARDDRTRPGEYNYPSFDFSDKTKTYIDPFTGVLVKLVGAPKDIAASSTTETFLSPLTQNGACWSITGQSATYSGTSQCTLFFPISDPSVMVGNDWRTPDFVQWLGTLSGSASSVKLCLTLDRSTPTGKCAVQPITSSPLPYTIGDTVPVLKFWQSGPNPPIINEGTLGTTGRNDIRKHIGHISKTGTAITWVDGDLFSVRWSSTSIINLGGTNCAIASIQNDKTLTLTSSGCVADGGSIVYTAVNFGFLLSNNAVTNTTISVSSPSWQLGVSGFTSDTAAGFYDLTSPVQVTGPGGEPGYLTSNGITFGLYETGNTIYFIGKNGTANLIGLSYGTVQSSGLVNAFCGDGLGLKWDGLIAGKYYCLGSRASDSAIILYSITYTGAYTGIQVVTDQALSPETTAAESGDLAALTTVFDANFATFNSPACSWKILGWAAHGTKGAIQLECTGGQGAPAYWVVYSLDSNTVIAAMCSVFGGNKSVNRWHGDHTSTPATGTHWIISSSSILTYTSTVTFGTLPASPWLTCPTNTVDPTLNGTPNCSGVLTLNSITPLNGSSQSLYSQPLKLGDYLFVSASLNELVRILTISGNNIVVQRAVRQYDFGSGGAHSGTLILTAYPGAWYELWWDWLTDPHGTNPTTTLEDPQSKDCHYFYSAAASFFMAGCLKTVPAGYTSGRPLRDGAMPANLTNPVYIVNDDAPFAGNTYLIPANYIESHPSHGNFKAIGPDLATWANGRPYSGDINTLTGAASLIGGTSNIYVARDSAILSFKYKLLPLLSMIGNIPLTDVSPAVLTDTSADWYKFCLVVQSTDCWPGGTVIGDVFMNVPFVTSVDTNPNRFDNFSYRDLSLTHSTHTVGTIEQGASGLGDDRFGRTMRRITSGFGPLRNQSIYWNGRAMPDNSWFVFNVINLGNIRQDYVMAKLPPYPAFDSVNRGTFIPVPIQGGGKAGDTVRIKFGYAEFGDPSLGYCTERQDPCYTDASGVEPFVYASETQQYLSASGAWNLNIPVLPGHTVYWSLCRLNGAEVCGPMQPIAVP